MSRQLSRVRPDGVKVLSDLIPTHAEPTPVYSRYPSSNEILCRESTKRRGNSSPHSSNIDVLYLMRPTRPYFWCQSLSSEPLVSGSSRLRVCFSRSNIKSHPSADAGWAVDSAKVAINRNLPRRDFGNPVRSGIALVRALARYTRIPCPAKGTDCTGRMCRCNTQTALTKSLCPRL
jgi:hypothetical protein